MRLFAPRPRLELGTCRSEQVERLTHSRTSNTPEFRWLVGTEQHDSTGNYRLIPTDPGRRKRFLDAFLDAQDGRRFQRAKCHSSCPSADRLSGDSRRRCRQTRRTMNGFGDRALGGTAVGRRHAGGSYAEEMHTRSIARLAVLAAVVALLAGCSSAASGGNGSPETPMIPCCQDCGHSTKKRSNEFRRIMRYLLRRRQDRRRFKVPPFSLWGDKTTLSDFKTRRRFQAITCSRRSQFSTEPATTHILTSKGSPAPCWKSG
jgi:hypothetical protein